MGAQFSKRRTGGRPSAPVSTAGNFQYMEELSSYEAACRIDSEIQSFDAGLQRRTSRVISNLAVNVELHSLSFDTLKEVVGSLLDMNHDVVRVILECKKDIWNNPELSDLVEDYFDNSLQTLDFCAALEKCLNRARNSQLIVQLALQCFDEEQIEKTLEALGHFKAAGDPFTEEFIRAFQSVYTQQLAMLEKLHLKKSKLDRKLSSVKAWRKVSCIIFASAFAALLICSVVAALVAAPPIAAAVAAASSIPLGSMGKWFDSIWKDCQDAIQAEKELISTIKAGTFVVVSDLDSIRFLVNRLEDKISSLLEIADFSLRDEEAVKFGIDEIRKKMAVFMRSVEDLGQQADRCSRDIGRARTVVLQRIIKHPK